MQMTIFEMQPAMEAIQLVEDTIRDYQFMLSEIERLSALLVDDEEAASKSDDNAGIRAQNRISDPTGNEVVRRNNVGRQEKRLLRLKDRVDRFDRAMDSIIDDKEIALLELLIDKTTVKNAAIELGFSRQHAHELKSSIVRKIAIALMDRGEA